ncbi:MAG: hypothetical protein LUQ38_10105 [Methanotrichaceae archaeon]|nr:hypothetical protein [Methanotrichaceae archaeon]
MGYHFDIAANWSRGPEGAATPRYDLIHMDVRTPKMNDSERPGSSDSVSPIKDPVIIGITADGQEGDRERCLLLKYGSAQKGKKGAAQRTERNVTGL